MAGLGIVGCSDNETFFVKPPLDTPVLIINGASKKCLSFDEKTPEQPTQAICGKMNEHLILTEISREVYSIKAPASNMCLEIPEAGSSQGVEARFAPCTGKLNQRLKLEPSLLDWRFLKISFVQNEKCLDEQGGKPFIQSICNRGNSQDFLISLPKPDKPILLRKIWTFWDKGEKAMPGFYLSNLERWNSKLNKSNKDKWEIKVVNLIEGDENYFGNFIEKSSVPTIEYIKSKIGKAPFEKKLNPYVIFSDFIRLEVLYKFGGVWMDPSIMLQGDLSETISILESVDKFKFAGFTSRFQSTYKWRHAESFENFFMVALAKSELIYAWKENFRKYWDNKKPGMSVADNPLYANIEIDFSKFEPLADYLNQHIALNYTLLMQPKMLDEIYILGGESAKEKGPFTLLELVNWNQKGELVGLSPSEIEKVLLNMDKVLISKFPSNNSTDFRDKDKQFFFDTKNIFGRLNSLL